MCLADGRSTAYFNSLLLRGQARHTRPSFPLQGLEPVPKEEVTIFTAVLPDEKSPDDLSKTVSRAKIKYIYTHVCMYVCVYI